MTLAPSLSPVQSGADLVGLVQLSLSVTNTQTQFQLVIAFAIEPYALQNNHNLAGVHLC